jgi:hypothetical protein
MGCASSAEKAAFTPNNPKVSLFTSNLQGGDPRRLTARAMDPGPRISLATCNIINEQLFHLTVEGLGSTSRMRGWKAQRMARTWPRHTRSSELMISSRRIARSVLKPHDPCPSSPIMEQEVSGFQGRLHQLRRVNRSLVCPARVVSSVILLSAISAGT